MAQSFPTWRDSESGTAAPPIPRWIELLVLLVVVGIAAGLVDAARRWAAPMTPAVDISLNPASLPRYAGLSLLRMSLAYLLSLLFALSYARLAAASPALERLMLPLLDILQSIPILSFLPGVVLALVALFPHSNFGLELAAIILIFTSQAWNLAFGFHQSLLTIPHELDEAAAIYRFTFWHRFTRLEIPFGMISLIWNSMMSWAGGWFFLMAAEQFTLGDRNFRLPGLGSYLATAADRGDVTALVLGLVTLIGLIVVLDQVLWRPLVAWGERFKFEQIRTAEPPRSAMLTVLRRSRIVNAGRRGLQTGVRAFMRVRQHIRRPQIARHRTSGMTRLRWRDRTLSLLLFVLLGLVALWGVQLAVPLLGDLGAADWRAIAVGAGATLLRTIVALVIAVAWTVPVGVALGLNPRWAVRAQPLVQMVASIPATALFPAILLLFVRFPGGLNLAAVLLMLLGTQWYVLFNVLAGATAIPADLTDAAGVFQLSRWQRWRFLILPGIFPYLVTGMITATGGAWNASVVAEYVSFAGQTYHTVGLGSLIAESAARGQFALLLASTLIMSALVIAANRLVWRRLYRAAAERYRLD